MKKLHTKLLAVDIAECALFSALMVAGAVIKIPFFPVPLTFQTVFSVLAGLLLGWKKGVIATFVYMLLGLVGLPVFANGGFGFAYVLSPTFGYIVGFIVASAVSGLFYSKPKKLWLVIVLAVVATLVNYVVGIPYFLTVWRVMGHTNITTALVNYNLLYLPKDILLAVLASLLAWRVAPAIHRGHIRLKNK